MHWVAMPEPADVAMILVCIGSSIHLSQISASGPALPACSAYLLLQTEEPVYWPAVKPAPDGQGLVMDC